MSDTDFDELAADLAQDAKESFKENREEQAAFLDAVADDEFQMLKVDKPDGVSWAYYLTEIRTVDND